MKIKKGDTVIVLTGKDKGREGKVAEIFSLTDRIVIDGVNMRKRHQKATRSNTPGQIVSYAAPMHVSNVALKDPKTGKPSRIGYKIEGGKKLRIAKKSGSAL
ncbi:MAG: 50S ribosomal protein L24 [Candidatus Yonathbacteria bacterium]|nr:50S ribosomal protein L24 [Candidatus Yonathbacteria bacterium]